MYLKKGLEISFLALIWAKGAAPIKLKKFNLTEVSNPATEVQESGDEKKGV